MKVDLAYPRPSKFLHPLTGHICLQVWAMHRGSAGFLWVGHIWVLSFFPLSEVWMALGTGAISLAGLGSGPGVEVAGCRGFLLELRVHGVFLAFLFIPALFSNL